MSCRCTRLIGRSLFNYWNCYARWVWLCPFFKEQGLREVRHLPQLTSIVYELNTNLFPKGTSSPPWACPVLSSTSSVQSLEPQGLMAASGEGVHPGCSQCTVELSIPVAITEGGRHGGGESWRLPPGAAGAGHGAEHPPVLHLTESLPQPSGVGT